MGLKTKTILQISPHLESSDPNSDQSSSSALQFHNTQNQNLNSAVVRLWNLPTLGSDRQLKQMTFTQFLSIPVTLVKLQRRLLLYVNLRKSKKPTKQYFQ